MAYTAVVAGSDPDVRARRAPCECDTELGLAPGGVQRRCSAPGVRLDVKRLDQRVVVEMKVTW
jgi:hypothetical protein